MNLTGNTILITGGSGGIGLQMAQEFLKRGNTVIVTGRNAEKLKNAQAAAEGLHVIQSDVSDPEEIGKLFQRIQKEHPDLNMLINNAGIMSVIDFQKHELSSDDLTREVDINLKGTIWMNDAFLPLLKGKQNAAIVNLSSGLAFAPLPISPVYCASKAAVHSYTVSLREQLRNTAVKVFELAPPATQTDMINDFEEEDMEGTKVMPVADLVAAFLKGFAKDKYEICPGQASQLKFMGRFFPGFILKQLSKPLDRMHAKS